jgi:hypothetical protein
VEKTVRLDVDIYQSRYYIKATKGEVEKWAEWDIPLQGQFFMCPEQECKLDCHTLPQTCEHGWVLESMPGFPWEMEASGG